MSTDAMASAGRSASSDRNAPSRASSTSSARRLTSGIVSEAQAGSFKAKSSDPAGSTTHAERASISSPPPSSWRLSLQQAQRRPSGTISPAPLSPGAQMNNAPTSQPATGNAGDASLDQTSQINNPIESGQPNSSKHISGSSRFSAGSLSYLSSSPQPSTTSSINGSELTEGSNESMAEHKERFPSLSGLAPPPTDSRNRSEDKASSKEADGPISGLGFQVPAASGSNPSIPNTVHLGSRKGNKPPGSRRLSGVNFGNGTGTASPNSERSSQVTSDGHLGVIGICALDAKARSKPSRNILNRINSRNQFEVLIFGDKVILDEEPENWPLCDYLISFFSDGFPLDKAIAYVRLRKPFTVNDLPMQTVLWDRRICLQILDRFSVPTPKRLEVIRDGGPVAHTPEIAQHIYERTGVKLRTKKDSSDLAVAAPKSVFMSDDNTLKVDGKELQKPFVEKPVSGEDHNIHIYYAGGGGRRLFRKVNNKSSEADDTLNVPRCITDTESSYIYESFVSTSSHEDVKAYTVGPDYCHAETRKSPVVDGIVKRNTHGKEVRYITSLSPYEASIASRISEAFGQRVCGFDLLRVNDKSYVIDVNGWSFVKDNTEYYEKCANIMKELFVKEKMRKEGRAGFVDGETGIESGLPNRPSGAHLSSLRSILRSPSMSRLAGNLYHATRPNDSSSTDLPSQTVSMAHTPSIERGQDSKVGKDLGTSPEKLPPPATSTIMGSKSTSPSRPEEESLEPVPPPATKSQWTLKGMVAVIRHADRTPKQKFKFTFHTRPFVELLKGHKEEVLLTGEAALKSVEEAAKTASREGLEDLSKLEHLQNVLAKKGALVGTKVQIKPMFRSRPLEKDQSEKPDSSETTPVDLVSGLALGQLDSRMDGPSGRKSSIANVTLSRAAAADDNLELEKLQLIVKWGGEPTHSARYQSSELGENMRNDLLLMNRDTLQDLKVFSSSERRVTTSAQIWTAAFLNVTEIAPDYVEIRKDLLDDSNAAKDEMDKVKKKLKSLLRKGNKAPAQFAWPENMPEPYLVARSVVELMTFHRRVMRVNFAKLDTSKDDSAGASGCLTPKDIQSRWCSGEDATLFKERWEKLFDEFCDAEKVDPGKISELHDTIKFDALHNRAFLEWIFTPSTTLLQEFFPSESKGTTPPVETDESVYRRNMKSEASTSSSSDRPQERPTEKAGLAHRMGFRKRASVVDPSTLKATASDPSTESYFSLYSSQGKSRSKQDVRLEKLRELFLYSKILFDFIGPQEYGIADSEKLEIGLLTSLPLLRAIVSDVEDMQSSDGAKTRVYFTKESHIYTLLNCIIEGGIKTKIQRNKIPELDYLSTICFELYESQNPAQDNEEETFNYSIRITISPGCHTFEPLDVQLDSKHCIGFAQRRSLTAHGKYQEVVETLRAKFHTVKLPKSFVAINLSEKGPSDELGPDFDAKPDEQHPVPPTQAEL